MKTIIACMLLFITICGYSQPNRLTSLKSTLLLSEISVNPAALDFDSTLVNQSSTMQMVVKNTGFGVLTVTSINSGSPIFAATPTTFYLAANQEQIVDVTFTPDEAVTFYGNLNILNDSPTPFVMVICTGIGKWPLAINPLKGEVSPFTLYPNPINDKLNLMTNLEKATQVSIGICDMTGKKRADIQNVIVESADNTVAD